METQEPFERTLAAARTGAGWALSQLFHDLYPRLMRYFSSFAPRDAEGLASDTWLTFVGGLERFRGGERDLRAYAFKVARERLVRPSGARLAKAEPAVSGSGPILDPDGPVLIELDTETALARIMTLPLEQAEVVLLRVLGDLSVDEVSGIVDKRPGTVRLIQQAAVSRLAKSTTQDQASR